MADVGRPTSHNDRPVGRSAREHTMLEALPHHLHLLHPPFNPEPNPFLNFIHLYIKTVTVSRYCILYGLYLKVLKQNFINNGSSCL